MSASVLLLDPDPRLLAEPQAALERRGWSTRLETTREAAEAALAGGPFDLVLAETRLFGELLPKGSGPGTTKWILLDTFALLHGGVGALKRGAFEVLARPVALDQLLLTCERALAALAIERELANLRQRTSEQHFGQLSSRSPRLGALFDLCRRVADSSASLLITGESGTGKSELARAIHAQSRRAEAPFVEVHCGALAGTLLETELFGHAAGAFTGARGARAGKFEAAHTGTLFLDELATASLDLQIKLLRVLETGRFERVGETLTRQVDVRVIAATNVDLAEEVASGRFREDLYWRIQVVALELPSLRERPEDVELLAGRFLSKALERQGRTSLEIEPAALDLLRRHPWPGNVRELRQAMERAALLTRGERLSAADLSGFWSQSAAALARRSPRPAPSWASAPGQIPQGDPRSHNLPAPNTLGPQGQSGGPPQPLTAAHPGDGPAALIGRASTGACELPPTAIQGPFGGGPPQAHGDAVNGLDSIPLGPLAEMLQGPERRFLERALLACGGSRQGAAALLGINRSTLFNKLRKHGLLNLQRPPPLAPPQRPAA